MYVACSTQCFARLPLDRALRLIAELEFSKVDVAISGAATAWARASESFWL